METILIIIIVALIGGLIIERIENRILKKTIEIHKKIRKCLEAIIKTYE